MGHTLTKISSGGIAVENAPAKMYSTYKDLPMRTTGGNNVYVYLFFNNPMPISANGVAAFLRIKNVPAWAGSNTISVRMITTKWSASKLSWNTRPTAGAIVDALTKVAPVAGTEWEFDLSTEMQLVADGGVWWGVRLEVNVASNRMIGGPKSADDFKPELEIEWSDAPEAPDELYPSAGRLISGARPQLKGNFEDVTGNTTMQAYQVQINDVDAWVSGIDYDSGTVAATEATHTLTYDLASDVNIYWRMRVQDGAGIWSEWSRAEVFQRHDHSSLTLNSPAVGTPAYVEDSTPLITWTFGGTQKHYCLIVRNLTQNTEINSGKITSTANSANITFPAGSLNTDLFQIELRVWDSLNREANVQMAYKSIVRDFIYNPQSATTPVAALTAGRVVNGPGMYVEFTRGSAPDKFTLFRDNVIIMDDIDPADVFVSGTTYRINDYAASARKSHTWQVIPVVGTGAPTTNPTVTASFRSNPGWLAQAGGVNALPLFNMNTSGLAKVQSGTTKQVLGSSENIVLSVSRGGYAGTVTARVASYGGISSDTLIDRLNAIRMSQNPLVYFAWSNQSIVAAIDQISWLPVSKTEEVIYEITFSLYERSKM